MRKLYVLYLGVVMLMVFCPNVRGDGVACMPSGALLGRNYSGVFFHNLIFENDKAFKFDRVDGVDLWGIFDVSDPLEHQMISGVEIPSFGPRFVVRDGYAYLCVYGLGLYIVDISDPVQPSVIQSSVQNDRVYELATHQDSLIVSSDDGMYMVDLDKTGEIGSLYNFLPEVTAWSFEIEGDYVYVMGQLDGLVIVDIAEHENASVVSRFETGGSVTGVDAFGDQVFLTERAGRMIVVNVQDPADPFVLREFDLPTEIWGLVVDEVWGVVYVFGNLFSQGALAFDISNLLGVVHHFEPTNSGAWSSVYVGTNLYTASGPVIYTLDSTDPKRLEQTAFFDSGITSRDIALSGETLCVAGGSRGLVTMSVDFPDHIEIMSEVDLPGLADSVVVQDEIAYVGTLAGGISIVDLNDHRNLELLSSFDTDGLVRNVFVQENYLYAVGSSGLMVFDMSDLHEPALVYDSDTSSNAWSVYVDEDRLYLGLQASGIDVFDVSNPSSPILIGHIDAADRVREIEMYQDVLYYTVDHDGVYAIGIDHVSELGYVQLNGEHSDLHFVDDVAYLSVRDEGVYSLNVENNCLVCPADLNDDGAVDFFDVSAFLQHFRDQTSEGDLTGDGEWNFFDVSAFLLDFAEGCP